MLKRLGRRFYSAKYVFSVHLHSVSPWFAHDKPVRVVWKRGAKKHKRGETSTKMPTRIEGDNVRAGDLKIEEGFELGVTLYATSNKTKKTGPYGPKDLKMVIMEVDDDGSVFSILGALTINLNDYVGGMENRVKLPVQCDKEVVNAVGQPYIDITVRSWYKQGGTASASSGFSSTGFSEHNGSDSEEQDIVITTGDAHLDPVKPLDVLDPRKSIGALTIDSVPEHIVEVDGTVGPASMRSSEDTEDSVPVLPIENESSTVPISVESEKKSVHDDALIEKDEATDKPPVTSPEPTDGLPKAEDLISIGRRYNRLSTINSEAGEDVEEFMDADNEDALKEFIKNELGEDEMENIPEIVFDPSSEEKDIVEATPIDESQETEPITIKESSVASSEIQEPEKTIEVPPPMPPMPVPVEDKIKMPIRSKSNEAKPSSDVVRPRVPPSKPNPQMQRRRGWLWWLPGSNLVCCQPALPRES